MNIEISRHAREAFFKDWGDVFGSRRRSAGVLTQEQELWCRSNGIPLAFDPVQIGWVPEFCEDVVSTRPDALELLQFRAWEPRDAATLAHLLSSEALWQYLPESYRGPVDTDSAAQLIVLNGEDHNHVDAALIGDRIIGQGRLHFTDPGSAELSYWIGEAYWGSGYGSRLVREFCDRTLPEYPDLDRVFARVHKNHVASQRILSKNGFQPVEQEGDWTILELRETHTH